MQSYLLATLFLAQSVTATRLSTAFVSTSTLKPTVLLHAKSASKNKNSRSGGFGKTQNKRKQKEQFTYPPLEPSVLQTLVPPPTAIDDSTAGILSEEIYDRLEAIYGLPQFNFGGENSIYRSIGMANAPEEKKDDGGSLFDDLLKTDRDDSLDNLFESAAKPTVQSYDLNTLPAFTNFRVLHTDPMVLVVDDFLSSDECDRYIQLSVDAETNVQSISANSNNLSPLLIGKSLTVGKDSRSQAQRTSTTWFHYYEGVPELMCKASRLLGLDGIERWEEPQTVRYRRKEKFTWHLDALSPEAATDPSGAGQRVATLLVYLTDLKEDEGGSTMFRDLGGVDEPLKVRPKKGSALLFFPSAGGIPNAPFDIRTLHCGEAVSETAENEKWIAQLWLCQKKYTPTAPENNLHSNAMDAIRSYCESTGNK